MAKFVFEMTKEELVARLRDIEWDDFEVKSAKSELPKNIWETVSAFSNTSGGWIVLAVKQSGKTFEIQGVENAEKLEQDFLGTLRSGKFNQTIFARPEKYNIGDCNLLAFYIPEVDMKPLYFGNPTNTFIRMGSGDQRATEGEIRAMFRNQSFGKKTEETIPNSGLSMLNLDSLHNYRFFLARQVIFQIYAMWMTLISVRVSISPIMACLLTPGC
ncbi:MAG: helix-turn-helix domain-containing protein [Muribaculaceae bacterium]